MPRLRIDKRAEEIAAMCRTAERELQAAIRSAVSSGATGTAVLRRRQLASVRGMLSELLAGLQKAAPSAVEDAYRVGTRVAELDIAPSVQQEFGGRLHTEAISILADNLIARLDAAVQHLGRQAQDLFRREQLRAVSVALLTGETGKQRAARFERALREQGTNAFTDKLGREWGLGAYAEMATRTVTREAVTLGTKNRLIEHGLDLVTSIASGDADDQPCSDNNRKDFSLTGATPGYPVLEDPPPYHPNCRCVIAPAAANFADIEAALVARS